ncbi:MAG TPA: four helix bundle protein [Methylomirabilota bacterium]|nr:four helix bundle protein [Methylomirabilota bacterium]
MNDYNEIRSFRDLLVWQKGIALTKDIYALTQRFPTDEKFGLVSQLRRAAVSVPSNIAEGQARRSSAEFSQFLSVSLGSLAELETQLIIVKELQLAAERQVDPLIAQVHELQKMLHSLRAKLTTRH